MIFLNGNLTLLSPKKVFQI